MPDRNTISQLDTPSSLAIGGAWGYIGRKFLEAARVLRIPTYAYDPGDAPNDLDLSEVTQIDNEAAFFELPVEMFHLAMHPEHRRTGLNRLLKRSESDPVLILNEKPMAAPESPRDCQWVVDAVSETQALMLYDFPELFDPLTARILEYLSQFNNVRIQKMTVQRSKDREDPSNPRNYKRMVSIQYQESVHCLAFVLYILGRLTGDLNSVFEQGLSVQADSDIYVPPNPDVYHGPVDGRCIYRLALAGVDIEGTTDFKRYAAWSKRRTIEGVADGRPFSVEVDYLEGQKRLSLDGVDQGWDARHDSYQAVLQQAMRWARSVPGDELTRGVYPNPAFAQRTYQLCSVLWRSSQGRHAIQLNSQQQLLEFDACDAGAQHRNSQ